MNLPLQNDGKQQFSAPVLMGEQSSGDSPVENTGAYSGVDTQASQALPQLQTQKTKPKKSAWDWLTDNNN